MPLSRIVAVVVLSLLIACKDRSSATPANVPTGPPPDSFRVALETNKGLIEVEIVRAWAPTGADRFYELVNAGYFDENRFFRVLPGFVAQFGVNDDRKTNEHWDSLLVADDSVRQSNVRGTIAYAQDKPNSRSHQLFISLGNNVRLDKMGFAPIGHVVSGMSVADSIFSGYGQKPVYNLIRLQGNSYLRRMFPKLDYIRTARVTAR